ncbi:hypothetical protein AB1Y20_023574 [Prymnesium parvum]|uniref:tRNA-uridine aminocarboxypropyltransferase n=1 Tax=Prymnesium parvum TaxID=97485 RepID=A0AB34JE93_PRYPA
MAREVCGHCRRPRRVCLCEFLPATPVLLRTPVLLLQHPHEARRRLQTAALLELCLDSHSLAVVRGRSLGCLIRSGAWAERVVGEARTPLLLFPRVGAIQPSELAPAGSAGAEYCLVVIDGTWKEVNEMLRKSSAELEGLACIDVAAACGLASRRGLYAARKPPQDGFFSTLEAVAYAVGVLESAEAAAAIVPTLLRPMVRMAQQQLELTVQHGFQVHRTLKSGYRPNMVDDVNRAAAALCIEKHVFCPPSAREILLSSSDMAHTT